MKHANSSASARISGIISEAAYRISYVACQWGRATRSRFGPPRKDGSPVKRLLALLVAAGFLYGTIGCGGTTPSKPPTKKSDKPSTDKPTDKPMDKPADKPMDKP